MRVVVFLLGALVVASTYFGTTDRQYDSKSESLSTAYKEYLDALNVCVVERVFQDNVLYFKLEKQVVNTWEPCSGARFCRKIKFKTVPIPSYKTTVRRVNVTECCHGYYAADGLGNQLPRCIPYSCQPNCVFGLCTAPNECTCNPGYTGATCELEVVTHLKPDAQEYQSPTNTYLKPEAQEYQSPTNEQEYNSEDRLKRSMSEYDADEESAEKEKSSKYIRSEMSIEIDNSLDALDGQTQESANKRTDYSYKVYKEDDYNLSDEPSTNVRNTNDHDSTLPDVQKNDPGNSGNINIAVAIKNNVTISKKLKEEDIMVNVEDALAEKANPCPNCLAWLMGLLSVALIIALVFNISSQYFELRAKERRLFRKVCQTQRRRQELESTSMIDIDDMEPEVMFTRENVRSGAWTQVGARRVKEQQRRLNNMIYAHAARAAEPSLQSLERIVNDNNPNPNECNEVDLLHKAMRHFNAVYDRQSVPGCINNRGNADGGGGASVTRAGSTSFPSAHAKTRYINRMTHRYGGAGCLPGSRAVERERVGLLCTTIPALEHTTSVLRRTAGSLDLYTGTLPKYGGCRPHPTIPELPEMAEEEEVEVQAELPNDGPLVSVGDVTHLMQCLSVVIPEDDAKGICYEQNDVMALEVAVKEGTVFDGAQEAGEEFET